ncbi:methionyl-tRNA formyltransferase [Opitutus sp. GAS368]|jgi:methionyl-tRNA formyltransferase|uniref:methionyl-tRNA formyltransferase n=1 Tax=Opitutus sp. GAS368 TaxID=1882749 RepID=UPI00087B53FA|nr:methionyl-tRNA formyltransferase [Opitutus sp. GAS368]SDS60532.1 methionyl-tRNA formyltransferase [Opitutus sp. GAS368]
MLRIVFMGSDAIARPALDWLAGEGSKVGQVVAVFTQPDRAAGRGQKIQPGEIKLWAQARNLPVLQPEKFGDAECRQLAELKPDLALVMAYGHILKQGVIDTPRLGTLNLHTSILPQYRGASPIQTATASGDKETGVTLMRMVLALDAGPVTDVERVAIAPLDTAAEVETKLALACVPLLARCLPRIAAGAQSFTAQDEIKVTFCRKLEKTDGVLDFTQPAAALAARINGLMPWPGCTVEINGQVVKLGLADALPGTGSAGEVSGADADGLLVGTGQGILRLRKLQRPGGKMLPAAEFLRGWPVVPGTRLPSHPMPPLVGSVPFPRPSGGAR